MIYLIISFIASLVIAIGWIYFFWRLDKHEKEPIRGIVITFILGAIVAFLAGAINTIGLSAFDLEFFMSFGEFPSLESQIKLFLYLVLIVGVGEELAKYIPVRLYAFRKDFFNEPFDGLVYASASAAGFMFIENLHYIIVGFLNSYDQGLAVIVSRLISSLMHILFASYWGLELGLYKKNPSRMKYLIMNFFLAAFLHGLYDFFIFVGQPLLTIPLIVTMAVLLKRKINYAQRISPFNKLNYLIECKYCHNPFKANALYCSSCGKQTKWIEKENPLNLKYFCGNCQSRILFGQKKCNVCNTKIYWN